MQEPEASKKFKQPKMQIIEEEDEEEKKMPAGPISGVADKKIKKNAVIPVNVSGAKI